MESKTLKLMLSRTTKSTGVYDEVTSGTPPVIKGLHLPLWYVGSPAPQSVEITVKAAQ